MMDLAKSIGEDIVKVSSIVALGVVFHCPASGVDSLTEPIMPLAIIRGFFDPALTECDGMAWAVAFPVFWIGLFDSFDEAAYLHG